MLYAFIILFIHVEGLVNIALLWPITQFFLKQFSKRCRAGRTCSTLHEENLPNRSNNFQPVIFSFFNSSAILVCVLQCNASAVHRYKQLQQIHDECLTTLITGLQTGPRLQTKRSTQPNTVNHIPSTSTASFYLSEPIFSIIRQWIRIRRTQPLTSTHWSQIQDPPHCNLVFSTIIQQHSNW
jgi:hypothetical protein